MADTTKAEELLREGHILLRGKPEYESYLTRVLAYLDSPESALKFATTRQLLIELKTRGTVNTSTTVTTAFDLFSTADSLLIRLPKTVLDFRAKIL